MKILDWKKYEEMAEKAIAEGCVLLENKGNVLPLLKGEKVSIFGRIQDSYYKSGTGSGGMVNITKVWSIPEGLESRGGVVINKKLRKIYADWEKNHPFDAGIGWGQEPWNQEEMPLTQELVEEASAESDVAIVIIGRTAGEDRDNLYKEGSYLLTKAEEDMMKKVRTVFKKMVVLLNVGNIIDMSFVTKYKPEAVMYVWQGGMQGGLGTADILTGKISPSGKLTDTIANKIEDYPSDKNFGGNDGNVYQEDIFVGYRYFETFAKDKVMYPFGFGLSYTSFDISAAKSSNDEKNQVFKVSVNVKNTGAVSGKEVVQVYVQSPNGKLGKASRVLVDFEKTKKLCAGESQTLDFTVLYKTFASYDDGAECSTGNKYSWILEAGEYKVFAGSDVRSATEVFKFNLEKLIVIKKCEQVLAAVTDFERWHNENGKITMEKAPKKIKAMKVRRASELPQEIKQADTNYKLSDVVHGNVSLEQFTAQLSDEDLSCIIRGEGMGSSLVTPGTASAYGGVSPHLKEMGIATVCSDDGPSGMRLDSGIKAFSLPNGTLLASTFNRKLVKELYTFTGMEMCSKKVDNLLGPGMNIHRHPLNGRNFEYFSEDPYITGQIGSAMIKGLQSQGVTGTMKHFCANNQETRRNFFNAEVSERALREIYLKGFEIAVENGADSVMSTYGKVNGIWTAGNYDLDTVVLRKEWGFTGIEMTDWWANINDEDNLEPNKHNFAAMTRAQNDIYMCCSSAKENPEGDNTLESLKDGSLTRGELQRNAMNILRHVMKTYAMKRLMGTEEKVQIINRPKDPDEINVDNLEFVEIKKGEEYKFDLTYQESKAFSNFAFGFEVKDVGTYEITLTGSSEMGVLAQIPVTIFLQGTPATSFTFNGTDGKDVALTKNMIFPARVCVSRINVGANGLKLKELKMKYISDKMTT